MSSILLDIERGNYVIRFWLLAKLFLYWPSFSCIGRVFQYWPSLSSVHGRADFYDIYCSHKVGDNRTLKYSSYKSNGTHLKPT